MAKSFNAIVSQIMADASSNQNLRIDLNRDHVFDAILQVMPAIIRRYKLKGVEVPMLPFCTTLPRLDVHKADFTKGGLIGEHLYENPADAVRAFGMPVEKLRAYVRLPQLMDWGGFVGPHKPAIEHVGPINGLLALDVFTGDDYLYAADRRYTGNQPFLWVSNNVGWLFSPAPIRWPHLTGRMVLADMREMAEFGRVYDENDTPFPAPDDFIDEVIKDLTNRYISMYGRHGAPLPSDGNRPAA